MFGIQTIEVTPPLAAALQALFIVSLCSKPGSPILTLISTIPGEMKRLLQSIILNFFSSTEIFFFKALIILPSIRTSFFSIVFLSGSITEPFFNK